MPMKLTQVRVAAAVALFATAIPALAVDWPSGFSKCADEGESCKVGSTARQVSFGSKGVWVLKTLTGTVSCSSAIFGSDPHPSAQDKCALGPVSSTSTSTSTSTATSSSTSTSTSGSSSSSTSTSTPTSTSTTSTSTTSTSAAPSGGYAGTVTGGGSVAAVTVSSAAQMQSAIDAYKGTGGLVLRYTGTFDFATIPDPCTQWKKAKGAIVEIKNKSDITIEGADGSAANFGLAVKAASSNIIIRNMTIGLLPGSIDAIGIEGQSGKVPGYIWVDHNTLFSSLAECSGAGDLEFDGLVDNKAGAHHITYSYNYIHDHHKVGLIGSSDSDASDRYITFHHNYYQNIGSRVPLQRAGYTHLYNNLYTGIKTSGANIRMGGYSLIEANYFENSQNPVTSRDSSAIGYWELRNNNIQSPSDFSTYGISWTASSSSPSRDAKDWVSTANFPVGIPYSYEAQAPSCVKSGLAAVAGAGKSLAKLSCQ